MISDSDLFGMIMKKNPDQTPDFIINEFREYKTRLQALETCQDTAPDTEECCSEQPVEQAVEAPKKRRYSKRSLKVKPEEAIQEDKIICCLCGKAFKSLTSLHLMKEHDLTVNEYKKLCGYSPDQSLMSRMNLRKVQAAVMKAQAARKANAEAKEMANAM